MARPSTFPAGEAGWGLHGGNAGSTSGNTFGAPCRNGKLAARALLSGTELSCGLQAGEEEGAWSPYTDWYIGHCCLRCRSRSLLLTAAPEAASQWVP